jgi:hypothetical protein
VREAVEECGKVAVRSAGEPVGASPVAVCCAVAQRDGLEEGVVRGEVDGVGDEMGL